MADQPRGSAAAAATSGASDATALQESLKKLHAVESSREAFAGQAVRLLAKAMNADAAALLVCDHRASRVRLVGATGADQKAFAPLLEQSGLWLTLRPLNERRINVIPKAQQNPFVPQALVTAINPDGLGIAVVPFYRGNVPVGALVLLSSRDATFSEGALRALAQALRVCAAALEDAFEVRAHRRMPLPGGPAPTVEPEPEAPREHEIPLEAQKLLERERKRVAELEGELGDLRELGDQFPALQAEVARLDLEAQQAKDAAEAARARAAKLEAERAEAENRAQAASEMMQALIDAREQQQRRIEETLNISLAHTDAVADLDVQLRELSNRVKQSDDLEAQLRASEASRAELDTRLHELEEAARRADELEEQLRSGEAARSDVERQVRELSERAAQVDVLEAQVQEIETARAALELDLAGKQEQHEELTSLHEQALRQIEEQSEMIESAREESRGAHEKFTVAERERERLLNEQLGVRGQLDAVMAERTALRDSLQAAQRSLAEKAHEEAANATAWAEQIRVLEGERDRLKAEAEQLRDTFESTFARLRTQIEQSVREKHEIETRLASLAGIEAETESLRSRVAELQGQLKSLRDAAAAAAPAATGGMILDDEMREAFGVEALDLVENCETLLARIAEDPSGSTTYQPLWDTMYTLKSAAAAVGLDDVVAQLQEGGWLVEPVANGSESAQSDLGDILARLVGSVKGLIHQALGLDSGSSAVIHDIAYEIARWRGLAPPPLTLQAGSAPGETRSGESANRAKDPDAGIIRVEAARLDALLGTLGKLDLTRGRTHREVQSVETLRDQLNTWRMQLVEGDATSAEGADPASDRMFHKEFASHSAQVVKELNRLIEVLGQQNSDVAALSCDMQQKIDELRLVPLEAVFRRLRRPVRDAARQEGKQVEFVTEGGHIQLDRSVIEPVHAPLLHLVRNAVAHGIEPPDERRAAGKPPKGTVKLGARVVQQSSVACDEIGSAPAPPLCLEITVADNGKGLDLGKMLKVARERGLIQADESPEDSQLAQLIFEPGFSTASSVTDLAGRGVGMDVVRQEVGALGGTIEIESKPGHGTSLRLNIPVRMAVQ